MTHISIAYDRLRLEEKMLLKAARSSGHEADMVDVKEARTGTSDSRDAVPADVVLERCVSYYRGLHYTSYLEFLGVPVINRLAVADVCGNKMRVSLLLKKSRIETPETRFAFSGETALDVLEETGYPRVIKPVVGSWGRGIMALRDRDAADAMVEIRTVTDAPLDRIYYLQEVVDRPPRDIRVIVIGHEPVAAMYREGEGFRTNVATGGDPTPCDHAGEVGELASRASEAVGGGILGIDMMEDPERGLVVHEVNNTVEFRGISAVTDADIPGAMVRYAVSCVRK